MSGLTSLPYRDQHTPFDGDLDASRGTIGKKVHSSLSVKRFIFAAPGVDDSNSLEPHTEVAKSSFKPVPTVLGNDGLSAKGVHSDHVRALWSLRLYRLARVLPSAHIRAKSRRAYKLLGSTLNASTIKPPRLDLTQVLKASKAARDSLAQRRPLPYIILELLAYQFTSPVRWIETQNLLFTHFKFKRLTEIGLSLTLAGMTTRTLKANDEAQNGSTSLM
ncbi:3-oxoacyl-[acyl-carrier-protein] synthase, partial [Tulasnella sp. UAMH 9824]